MGFITNVFCSFSLLFFLLAVFFFGVLRNDDLKLPLRGNLTIHDGGTMICEWTPEKKKKISLEIGSRREFPYLKYTLHQYVVD